MPAIPVALLGYGNSARTFHIPFVKSLPGQFELKIVLQRPRSSTSTSPDARADLPDVQVLPDLPAVLAAMPQGPGLVIVTTNNASHVPYAKQSLEAGKHVLIEKPVAVHEREIEELANLARNKGLVCSVYQNRRYDGDFLTIKSLLADSSPTNPSAIGIPTYFESRFDRFRPIAKGGWREEVDPVKEGGGMLWDLGAHLVDQVVSLFGPPSTIFGTVRNQRAQGATQVDDDWMAILTYPTMLPLPATACPAGARLGGLRVVLGSSCLSTHVDAEQFRFRVEGTAGSYVKHGTDPQEGQLKLGWTPASKGDAFGVYQDHEPAAVRLGRLTTTVQDNKPVTAAAPPRLTASDIPTLPGSYISLYLNLFDAIQAATQAAQSGQPASDAIDSILDIQLGQVAISTRVLRLIRQSSEEGRVLAWATA